MEIGTVDRVAATAYIDHETDINGLEQGRVVRLVSVIITVVELLLAFEFFQ